MTKGNCKNESNRYLGRVMESYRSAGDALADLAHSFEALQHELDDGLRHEAGDGPVGLSYATSRHVTVSCLGQFKLELNGSAVATPNGGRPLAVLKFLAARAGRPTPRDMLLEALWPGADPEASTNRLRVAVHSLRRDLGEDAAHLVEHIDGCYAFSPDGDAFLDTAEFEGAWRNGVRAYRTGDSQAAVRYLETAESLYAGDFLEDDVYEEWTLVEREFLRDIFLNVLMKLAAHSLEIGDYMGCQDRCRQIIRHDICNEEAYRFLMKAHLGVGQPSRALQWFSMCEGNLRRELDIEPSATLVELRDSITARRPPHNVKNAAV